MCSNLKSVVPARISHAVRRAGKQRPPISGPYILLEITIAKKAGNGVGTASTGGPIKQQSWLLNHSNSNTREAVYPPADDGKSSHILPLLNKMLNFTNIQYMPVYISLHVLLREEAASDITNRPTYAYVIITLQ